MCNILGLTSSNFIKQLLCRKAAVPVMKKATTNQMKKQLIFLAAVILITVSSWALLSGTTAYKKLSTTAPKCKKTCQEKPASNNAPQTGFFILDSFSGAL